MASADEKKILDKVDLPGTDILTFAGKLDTERTQELIITNNSTATVAFKLKITVPKLMRLIPGYGYVKPKDKFAIKIVAKASGTKLLGRDRVVVLLAVAPDGRPDNAVQFWRGASAPKDPRRYVFPLKFVEEAKGGGGVVKGDKSAAKPTAKTEASLGAAAGTAAGSAASSAPGSVVGGTAASSKVSAAATSAKSGASASASQASAASGASSEESGSEAESGAESDADESEQ